MTPESSPFERLVNIRDRLTSLQNDPCGFAHEFRPGSTLCDLARRSGNVCCAHGSLDVGIPRTIHFLREIGEMPDEEYEALLQEWNDLQTELRTNDYGAYAAAEHGDHTHMPRIRQEQIRIGHERMACVRKIVHLIDLAMIHQQEVLKTKSVQSA